MPEKTAKEDIVVETEAGTTVVLVHAGQPIPADIDERKAAARYGSIRTASPDEIEQARNTTGGKVVGATEDKARRSSRQKK